MSRIWRYVLVHDTGMAPCVDDGLLTLTCCKPMIRRSALPGEWIIGFRPKSERGRLAWIGQVAEVMTLGEYERRYAGRRDAVYRAVSLAEDGSEVLVPLNDSFHANDESRASDKKGRNALVFGTFWYWGANAVAAPDDIADLAYYHVGQTTKGSTPERIARLESWARSVASPGIHGTARDVDRSGDWAPPGQSRDHRPNGRRC